MFIYTLAIKSLLNRKFTVILTIMAISLSVTLMLGVERIRKETRVGFTSTISGTDLIVGARSGSVSLLLYSVFHIGNPNNNVSWESYQHISALPQVAWYIPISLGDSHRGFPVIATSQDYFEYYRYAKDRSLVLAQGHQLNAPYDVVLGAEVARKLGYQLGDTIVLAHGAGDVSFIEHDDKPFQVTAILEKTGTPVDQSLHITLQAMNAIHKKLFAGDHEHDPFHANDIAEKTGNGALTAFLIGLHSPAEALFLQRQINEYSQEPLTAIMPGVALQELWGLVGTAEKALQVVSVFVVIVGLFGMLTTLLTSLNERRREMAILRSVGARPYHVFSLIVGEAGLVTLTGVLTGMVVLYCLLIAVQPVLATRFGLFFELGGITAYELVMGSVVCVVGIIIGIIPGYRIYRYSLADGMTVRL